MKHVKTFESFQEQEHEFDFENLILESESEAEKRVKEAIKKAIEKLPEDKLEELKKQMAKVAEKLGLTPDKMTDENISKAMVNKGIIDKIQNSSEMNEGLFDLSKKILNAFLKVLGITGVLMSILILGLQEFIQHIESPKLNSFMTIGTVAFVLSVISMTDKYNK